jgi:hypothetical protein
MMKKMVAMSLFVFVVGCGKKDDKPADNKDKGAPSVKDGDKSADKGGDKKDPPKDPPKAEPAKVADLAGLNPKKVNGWEGEFNTTTKDWTFEKYTPGKDDINEANRFYVDNLPEDAPPGMDDYATKLGTDNFQDIGYKYTKIAEKTKTADGWLLVGTVSPLKVTDDDKPEPGFVMLREMDGARIRCKAGAFKSEKTRTEAIELCKSFKLK